MHGTADGSGQAARGPSDGRLRTGDSTEDERRCREQIAAGNEPAMISQAVEDSIRAGRPVIGMHKTEPGINAGEEEFGLQRICFPTERRSERKGVEWLRRNVVSTILVFSTSQR